MGGMRTLFAGCASVFLAFPCCAQPLEKLFATCAGRLSALTEFQWLMDGPSSEQTARERDAMAALAEATAPGAASVQLMDWRLQAKVAQAALLHQAAFGRDPQGRAARRAERLVADCRALLLS